MTAAAASPAAPEADFIHLRDYWPIFVEKNRVNVEVYPCHYEICDTYEAALTGALPGIEYICVHMPRRTAKTKILEALGTWALGEFDIQSIYGAYAEPLVKRTMRYMAATMARNWYKDLYGDLIHDRSSNLITTTEGGYIYGAGAMASVIGFGAGSKDIAGGYIAFDDPAKADEALSKIESAKVIQNFEVTWKGCRNSDRFCPIIVNAQRLGPNDLPGYLQTEYRSKTLVLKFPCFVSGKSQFPDTWSDSTMVDLMKTRIGRFVLASQFQQEPISLGGNLIQTDSFVRYDPNEAKSIEWDSIVITIDTALKTKEENDYSCAQAWGRAVRRAYLLDQAWGKWESPELLKTTIAFWHKINEDFPRASIRLVIEEKAAGTGLIQQLNEAGIPAQGIERDIDKVRRVQAVLPYQEAGLVYVPAPERVGPEHWVHGFLMECAEFKPDLTHAHDDRVDCFADGVQQLLGDSQSILELLGVKPRR